jgi:hypothetical protein
MASRDPVLSRAVAAGAGERRRIAGGEAARARHGGAGEVFDESTRTRES